jgi:hypothetical protein
MHHTNNVQLHKYPMCTCCASHTVHMWHIWMRPITYELWAVIGSPNVQAHWAESCVHYTLLPKRDWVMLHPIPNGDSRPSCFISTSSHWHGSCMSYSASFHPWKSCHMTTRSCVSTYAVIPQPLWRGLVVIVIVPTYVTPLHKGKQLVVSLCHHYTTNTVD